MIINFNLELFKLFDYSGLIPLLRPLSNVCIIKCKSTQARSNNFRLNVRHKILLCILAMWQSQISFPNLSLLNSNLSSNTQNLTYFTEAEGKRDSSRLAPLSFPVWLAVGLREIVVNLSRTWKVLYWRCDAAVGPDTAFDVLILSHWCQSTSAALILPRGSRLHSIQEFWLAMFDLTSCIKFSFTNKRFTVCFFSSLFQDLVGEKCEPNWEWLVFLQCKCLIATSIKFSSRK